MSPLRVSSTPYLSHFVSFSPLCFSRCYRENPEKLNGSEVTSEPFCIISKVNVDIAKHKDANLFFLSTAYEWIDYYQSTQKNSKKQLVSEFQPSVENTVSHSWKEHV